MTTCFSCTDTANVLKNVLNSAHFRHDVHIPMKHVLDFDNILEKDISFFCT